MRLKYFGTFVPTTCAVLTGLFLPLINAEAAITITSETILWERRLGLDTDGDANTMDADNSDTGFLSGSSAGTLTLVDVAPYTSMNAEVSSTALRTGQLDGAGYTIQAGAETSGAKTVSDGITFNGIVSHSRITMITEFSLTGDYNILLSGSLSKALLSNNLHGFGSSGEVSFTLQNIGNSAILYQVSLDGTSVNASLGIDSQQLLGTGDYLLTSIASMYPRDSRFTGTAGSMEFDLLSNATIQLTPVPEPTAMGLAAAGATGVFLRRGRRKAD